MHGGEIQILLKSMNCKNFDILQVRLPCVKKVVIEMVIDVSAYYRFLNVHNTITRCGKEKPICSITQMCIVTK